RLLDLQNDVADLETRAGGGAVLQHQAHDRRRGSAGTTAAELGLRAVGLAKNEAVLGSHALAGDGARHFDQPDVHRPPAVGTQHRQTRIALHGPACDLALELTRLGDRPPVERHDDVAALESAARGRRAVHDVDDHDAEALADAVFRRELVHLLLGQIADPYAEPRPRTRLGDAAGRQQPQRESGDRASHGRPPLSSRTSISIASATRAMRVSTSSVSSSAWRSDASGSTAAATR